MKNKENEALKKKISFLAKQIEKNNDNLKYYQRKYTELLEHYHKAIILSKNQSKILSDLIAWRKEKLGDEE